MAMIAVLFEEGSGGFRSTGTRVMLGGAMWVARKMGENIGYQKLVNVSSNRGLRSLSGLTFGIP